MQDSRPVRADAVRNRANILTAARELMTGHGRDVAIDAIAEAAGVAVGTLYRHFPTKTALVEAVIEEHIDHLAGEAESALARVRAGGRAVQELNALITKVVEASAHDRAIRAAATSLGGAEATGIALSRVEAALTAIIVAARDADDVRPDIALSDYYLLLLTAPTDQSPAARARWLSLILPGFAPR